ncbi:acyl-CoA dehydrogenase family protein [Martelella soudanensis]|uniref:acyl-CoA dehydrogenase family protein n=1 Tax=unclassified Martelella TaxID=2629616 RepID=UPI0015DFACF1|nr:MULTISPECIES: acyl-CoA dehydrogenase family protein [unclassified Martelella]
MTAFKAPVEDILFSLVSVAGAGRLPDFDQDMARDIVGHFAGFAEGVLAPLNARGDAEGCRLADGRVTMPDGFREAFAQLAEGGWQGLTVPEEFGGMGLSPVIGSAVSEIFAGANHAMQMVCGLAPGAVATLLRYGSDEQKQRWIAPLATGAVLSTMCLSEADAGSDLGRIRTRAGRDGDIWRLTGEKIFISGGDQDLSDNILHLVLARTGDPASGVRGLSLFACDRQSKGATLTIARIEEKLGLHASPTCQMVFDAAPAELIGVEGEGLKAMFTVMNHARIDVALQGTAHAARAAHIAAAYAGERVQGRKADGGPARLTDHADIRRMLNEQQALALGSRAMCHIALVEMALGQRPELVDFLTPLCKLFASEAGIRAADIGIQVLGGYGYLTEYGLSQVWRDARITSIYEGANGIHAQAIATRGLRTNGGKGADAFARLIAELAGGNRAVANLLDIWEARRLALLEAEDPAGDAHDFAQLTATLYFRAAWCRIADAGVATGNERRYRELKAHVMAAALPVAV